MAAQIENVQSGDLISADLMNQIIDKVNMVSLGHDMPSLLGRTIFDALPDLRHIIEITGNPIKVVSMQRSINFTILEWGIENFERLSIYNDTNAPTILSQDPSSKVLLHQGSHITILLLMGYGD